MLRLAATGTDDSVHRCSWAARWSPRFLGGSLFAAVLLVTERFEGAPGIIGSPRLRLAMWAGAGLLALWVLNKGAELRLRVGLEGRGLAFSYGTRAATLIFEEIETLRFDPPFAARRSFVAATTLLDRRGTAWRLPVALDQGDRLVASIVHRSGREDLAAWVEVLQVEARMRRGWWHVAGIYSTAMVILLAGVAFYVR